MTDEVVAAARRIADDVLFPVALETDRAGEIPVALLDAIADAGLFGIAGPSWAGGLDADFKTMCDAVEALSSGCLTTAFVWVQHHGAVRAAAASENEPAREWAEPLCRGTKRAGLALGVAGRCCTLLGPSPLDDEIARVRDELDRVDPATIQGSRAQAGELAVRAASTLSVSQGSRSLLSADHAQRLLREAFFTLVYALRPGSRDAVLAILERDGSKR